MARRSSAESWLTVSLLPATRVSWVRYPRAGRRSKRVRSLKRFRPHAYCGRPMESRWSDREAAEFVERFAPRWGEDLARRVYTSRLIGGDPDLGMHGGGNPSLKGTVTTLGGDQGE